MKDEGDSSMKLQQQQLSLHEKGLSRVIPPEVLEQLKAYLGVLPIHIRVIVILLLECGLRVSELCALPLDCLMRDAAGNWLLRCASSKTRSERTIPLSPDTAAMIQEQQQTLMQGKQGVMGLLFTDSKGRPVSSRIFMKQLNRLAIEKDLRDVTGTVWQFQAPQFRSTFVTHMIEQQVPIEVIQQYIGAQTLGIALRAHIRLLANASINQYLYYLHLSRE